MKTKIFISLWLFFLTYKAYCFTDSTIANLKYFASFGISDAAQKFNTTFNANFNNVFAFTVGFRSTYSKSRGTHGVTVTGISGKTQTNNKTYNYNASSFILEYGYVLYNKNRFSADAYTGMAVNNLSFKIDTNIINSSFSNFSSTSGSKMQFLLPIGLNLNYVLGNLKKRNYYIGLRAQYLVNIYDTPWENYRYKLTDQVKIKNLNNYFIGATFGVRFSK